VAQALRRKINTTKITKPIEIISVNSTSSTEARIVVVRSIITDSRMAGEIEACNCGRISRTRSTVSMMLAAGCR
jgi:hypothetical protein